mmetsp:Transcript_3959/g.12301  ORF Transcript_3959/g.12301 Transcript_3959/m.12301 type:complete len:219 (-) Transcript_3959:275-931(-)
MASSSFATKKRSVGTFETRRATSATLAGVAPFTSLLVSSSSSSSSRSFQRVAASAVLKSATFWSTSTMRPSRTRIQHSSSSSSSSSASSSSSKWTRRWEEEEGRSSPRSVATLRAFSGCCCDIVNKTSKGERPAASALLGDAPNRRSASTQSGEPSMHARCKGAWPLSSRQSTFLAKRTRSRTVAGLAARAAQCRAVRPSADLASARAFLFKSTSQHW